MAVRKPCRSKGCKTSPRCEHPWWLDVMHKGRRYRMPVDDFAFARGATTSITSKRGAEKVWEAKFIAEIASGRDPRIGPDRNCALEPTATVRGLSEALSNPLRRRRAAQEPVNDRQSADGADRGARRATGESARTS